VKWTSWGFLAFVGSLAFLALYIKDREIRAGVERPRHLQIASHSSRLSTPAKVRESERVVE
jgi:hypothetical protein